MDMVTRWQLLEWGRKRQKETEGGVRVSRSGWQGVGAGGIEEERTGEKEFNKDWKEVCSLILVVYVLYVICENDSSCCSLVLLADGEFPATVHVCERQPPTPRGWRVHGGQLPAEPATQRQSGQSLISELSMSERRLAVTNTQRKYRFSSWTPHMTGERKENK